MSTISAKSVVKYAVMPGIMPRAKRLFMSGFGMIAYLLANIYMMVRLLPRDHVYLNTANIGRFGVRHVVAEAASHLEFKPQYWDRITIFVIMLSGLVMMVAQLLLLGGALVFDPVWAQTATNYGNIFSTPDPVAQDAQYSTDVAFLLLDRVFGIPEFFCTVGNKCTDVLMVTSETGEASYQRWPFHVALHSMFEFYSMGLLVVAVLIFLYFIVVVVGETVTTGTPFGERFQNVWVPIRLVIALLLLTPVTYGLNTGQYITLFVAKAGSGFATNGWHIFNKTLKEKMGDEATPIGEKTTLLALPQTPDITQIAQAMVMVHGCAYGTWRLDETTVDDGSGDRVRKYRSTGESNLDDNPTVPPTTASKNKPDSGFYIRPYFYKSVQGSSSNPQTYMEVTQDTTFGDALDFYGQSNVMLVFGKLVGDKVEPTCGQIEVPVVDRSYAANIDPAEGDAVKAINDAITQSGGGAAVHEHYFQMVKQMWFGNTSETVKSAEALLLRHIAHRAIEKSLEQNMGHSLACKIGCEQPAEYLPSCTENHTSTSTQVTAYQGRPKCYSSDGINPDALFKAAVYYKPGLESVIKTARDKFVEGGSNNVSITTEVLDRGWGGAGIWYNTLGHMNGNFVAAVQAIPKLSTFPKVLEDVKEHNAKNNSELNGYDVFDPQGGDNQNQSWVLEGGVATKKLASSLYDLLQFITKTVNSFVEKKSEGVTGNAIIDAIHFVFGTQGIIDMRGENATVHPISQLSAVGKGIVDSSIRNIMISTGLSAAGGVISAMQLPLAGGLEMANKLFSATAFVGLTAGVTLYYVIPILPFVFFFFAVGGWVKGLFEAMVGVPLWALAHLRIDGEGLPGEAASGGYFLIFEVFLRPILIVFGLIAAMLIFGMQVRLLNVLWDLILHNVGGATGNITGGAVGGEYFSFSRDTLDQFFFTVIYTVIVYMMAMTSFKLIDMIPDSIMRWSGNNVTPFNDSDKNPADALMRYTSTGGMLQGQRIVEAGQKSAGALGQGLGKVVGNARGGTPQG